MKKTIKKEMEKNIIHSNYIDDNLLLECVYDEERDSVTIRVCYIKGNSIQETIFTTISMDSYMESFSELVRVSEQKDTIAVFKKQDSLLTLDKVYDIKEHSMIPEDFKDVVFKQKFPQEELGNNLVLKKTNSGGGINWQA